MARIFIDGWESGTIDLWDTNTGATVVAAQNGMSGNKCLELTGNSDWLRRAIPSAAEYYFSLRYRPIDSTNQIIISFWLSTVIQCKLNRNRTTNHLEIYRGTTLLASGTAMMAINATYLIEIRLLIADSGGRFVVKLNGVTDIDFTGDTQESAASNQMDTIELGSSQNEYSNAYFDDFILDDAAFPGDTRIQAIVPTGAGNSTELTPSTGENWACVDEVPANDADYVATNTVNKLDLYTMSNLTGAIDNIKCVQVQARAMKEGNATPQNIKLAVRSGATDYVSADKALTTSYKSYCNLWETDPATAAAWTESGVNAMEAGVKSAA
jgi:hypothetical protein